MWGADAVLWSAPTGVRMYMCGISGGRGPVILDGELIDSRDATAGENNSGQYCRIAIKLVF